MSERKAQQREFYDTYSADFDEVELWLINGKQNHYREKFMARRAAVMARLAGIKSSSSVLEIGCGTGNYTRFFAKYPTEMFGADLSAGMLKKVIEKVYSPNLYLIQSDAEHLPFSSGSFDAVLSINMLEHLDDIPHTLQEMKRVLKAGGKLVISTPNENWVQQMVRQISSRMLGRGLKRSFKQGSYRDGLTHQSLSLGQVITHLEECGIRPERKLYMGFIERELSKIKWLLPLMEAMERILEKMPLLQTCAGVMIVSGGMVEGT